MIHTILNKNLITAVLAAGMSAGSVVYADAPGADLVSWSQAAGKSVNSEMRYPQMAIRQGDEGTTTFRVSVDRKGNVLEVKQTKKDRSVFLNGASRRLVQRVDFPSLPAGYKGEKLTFSLNLRYAIATSVTEYKNLQRDATVSSKRIASANGPMTASIKILSEEAD